MSRTARVAEPTALPVDTGIFEKDRSTIARMLGDALADTYMLAIKTHVFHWNVVGPLFVPFHELTERLYDNLIAAADEIAERIRALGHPAPLGLRKLFAETELVDENSNPPVEQMVATLVHDHELVVRRLRDVARAAEDVDDLVTTDLMTERMAFHEKSLWMLRAMITGHRV